MLIPLTFLLRMALGTPFDEEEAERTFTYYLRKNYMGYVPMTIWDFMRSIRHLEDSPSKFIDTVPTITPPVVTETMREVVKYGIKRYH
jgi:hypothetical protein